MHGLTQRFVEKMQACRLCPRNCGVKRLQGELGYCRTGRELHIASITLHKGEEPVLSGQDGMCNVFFSHCNLQCIYCQNHQISCNDVVLTREQWNLKGATRQISRMLARGIRHVGFVSPSHPVIVYNSNGYDKVETLRQLEGLVDVYLPDCKYMDAGLAKELSDAADYPQVAAKALREMYRQMGPVLHLDADGLALRGMIVRHLVLPRQVANSLQVLRFLAAELSPKLTLSLMAQYRPIAAVAAHPHLRRRLNCEEYAVVMREMEKLGFNDGFVQELVSADYYWPDFSKPDPFNDTEV